MQCQLHVSQPSISVGDRVTAPAGKCGHASDGAVGLWTAGMAADPTGSAVLYIGTSHELLSCEIDRRSYPPLPRQMAAPAERPAVLRPLLCCTGD